MQCIAGDGWPDCLDGADEADMSVDGKVSLYMQADYLRWNSRALQQNNKILKSFASCYSKFFLLADFTENHTLQYSGFKIHTKNLRNKKTQESSQFINGVL